MTNKSRIRYFFSQPVLASLFKAFGRSALAGNPATAGLTAEEVGAFVDAIWTHRYSKIRCDPWEFREEFGRRKLAMILTMARHAATVRSLPLLEVVQRGRWEVKYQVRDRFTPGESTADARAKWAPDDVMFWNIIAGLKWEPGIFEPSVLTGATVLDYGCNVGALSYLARQHGAGKLLLVDVPGTALDFAASVHAEPRLVFPVTSNGTPDGLGAHQVDVAFCFHVLEHVPEPMEVVRTIHRMLRPGGIFYVTFAAMPETEGGCNLREAQSERPKVLKFLRESFEVLEWNERRVEYKLRKR